MARPIKQGVDYFSLDVHLDNKFKFVEIKYGVEGFGIVIKIIQNIYAQGYWAKWGEDEQLLFSGEHRIDYDKLVNVTEECLKRGIFNAELHKKHQILTSKGIQKRYKEIVRRRKDVEVIGEYLLIDGISQVNDGNNPTNDVSKTTNGQHDDGKSTQRKVKETKGKENKLKNKKTSPRKRVYEDESDEMKLVDYFIKRIRINDPDFKEPNKQTWADDFRKLIELDKKPKEEIGKLIRWVQDDEFERPNVMSVSKLRSRYSALKLKMNTPPKGQKNSSPVKEPSYRPDSVDLGDESFEFTTQ